MGKQVEPQDIIDNIRRVFIEQEKYLFDKHVPEFFINGNFLGDYYNLICVEPKADKPPRFYHTLSPFDMVSKKAPDRAIVFENGELLLDMDFTDYVPLRTAAMTTLVLPTVGVKSLKDKKIVIFGVGKVAQQSVKLLKLVYPELSELWCVSKSSKLDVISNLAKSLDVTVHHADSNNLSEFDIIICHTSADAPVLDKAAKSSLKTGVFIATFISSTEHGEVDDDYYDSGSANIVCDWEPTKTGAKDLNRALASGAVSDDSVIVLKDLLTGLSKIDPSKQRTIYRSVGTPIQNLAVLQLLV